MGLRKIFFITAGSCSIATMSIFAQELSGFDADHNDALLLAQNSAAAATTPAPTQQSGSEPKGVAVGAISAEPKPTPSQNVTINLIHRLVERGVLSKADADELIKQAEEDASTAREMAAKQKRPQSASENDVASQYFAEPTPIPRSTSRSTASPSTPSELSPPAEGDDAVTVSYVPEIVKEQLREEIRQEVMEQARSENWANPRTLPPWILRITPFMDLRLRYEGIFFPEVIFRNGRQVQGNDNTGGFPNFNAINTGAPFDTKGTSFPPELNVDQDRERARIRARFGAQMDLEDGFTMGLRIATGETNTPTSTNQSFGVANAAQGGNFSKYAIWLDRAFVKYELWGETSRDFVAEVGRFDNPFFTVSELMWDEDLGWDGLALKGKYRIPLDSPISVTPFATAGIFPVFNTELNFSSTRPDKFSSEDKFLWGGQLGASLRLGKDFSAKIAGAFYDFYNIEGKLSDPCVVFSSSDQCNTDDSRPSFAQKGNTYFMLRNIIPTLDNVFGTTKQFQYFGLATPFRVVDVSSSLDYAHFDPIHMTLFGQWIENVAFDWDDINAVAINNRIVKGRNLTGTSIGRFDGGNVGWIAGLKVGHPALEKRWDWAVGVNYRYLESDATVDAFNDSDFGLGGTNLKGYTVFGAVALSPRIGLALRWMSADEIGGPPFRNDTVQFDFNAKF
jgi:Putative porin